MPAAGSQTKWLLLADIVSRQEATTPCTQVPLHRFGEADQNSRKDRDPWDNGLGIFDLTKLEWRSSYNASAAEYDSPQIVKDWYHQKCVFGPRSTWAGG